MKSVALLIILTIVSGCSVTKWEDTGQQGPWCAPDTRAHIFYRTVNAFGAPNSQGEMALAGKSGTKQKDVSFHHELDGYFGKCRFIEQWPTHITVNSIPSHELPFDLCLVSINPMVIVGAERQNPKASSFGPLDKSPYAFIGSTYLTDPIAVRTTVPYHSGARVFWFSPAVDYDLHEIDLKSRAASFKIGKSGQIAVVVDGAELETSRK